MNDHLPECFLHSPCRTNEQGHVYQMEVAGISVNFCGLCMDPCICTRLRACKKRALDLARESVSLLSAPYKVKGDWKTYDPYNEGRMDMQDAALSAIDALQINNSPQQ
jgi:hypothetical protein